MTNEKAATPSQTASGVRADGIDWTENAIQIQRDRLVREIEDANLLLEYALANGKPVPDDLIADLAIQSVSDNGKGGLKPPDGFQTAYRDLVQFLAPVTAASLRATDDQRGKNVRLWAPGHQSAGKLWSRKLWFWTIAFAVFVVVSENYDGLLARFYPLDADSDAGTIRLHMLAAISGSIVPFAYGGLGALTYLLRSAHQKLHNRTFNTLRIPEYFNRMLLGVVSGGAVKLFVDQAGGGAGTVELSSSVLAFVAGYNCDFLFSAIERVMAAILPKVPVNKVTPKQPAMLAGVNLEKLLAQYEGASAEGKKVIEGLIERLKDRL